MKFPRPLWLLNSDPRPVQLEALRRAYYGYSQQQSIRETLDETQPVQTRPTPTPAEGWGHYLEMRLGKTPLVLNEFMLFEQDYGFDRLVVLSPNTFKQGWVDEAEKSGFLLPFGTFETSKDQLAWQFAKSAKGRFAIAVNYEALQYDKAKEFLGEFVNSRTLLVADESIKLKNHESLTTKAALAISKAAGATRVLSGLPMTQGPQDLYPQLRFVRQLSGTNPYAFRNRFCKMGGFKNKKIVGAINEEELTGLISSTAFVAKRKDWGKPGKAEYYTMGVELSPVQQKHYKEMDRDFVTMLSSGFEVTVDQVISKLLKLQQISSGFMYTENGHAEEIMDPFKTPKILRVLEFMREEAVGKVIVPYHYGKSGDILMEALAEYSPAVIRSGVWMKKNDRDVDAEKRRFNKDPKCRVMILQITSGKYGHDLSGVHGDRCGTMLFYENTYSLDDRGQIEMRNTASSQDWDNVYLDLVCSKIERAAIEAHIKKESLVTAILGAYHEEKVRIERN
jgi:hypothetical protein